jgi:hypothetical protein
MSEEPLFCTWCGAEDWDCDCRKDRCGPSYCEVDYTHEWRELGDGEARCVHCGLRALVHPSPEGGLRVVPREEDLAVSVSAAKDEPPEF